MYTLWGTYLNVIFVENHSLMSNLTTHSYTHTCEKHFKCDFCPKLFSHMSLLTTHSYTHTGEKSFKCYICSKVFSQMSDLTKH